MASTEDGQVIHANIASDEEFASLLVKRLEDREAARHGVPIPKARRIVARMVGLSPGTLENLRRGRIKAIKKHVYEWIVAAADRELATEIRRLEAERSILAAKAGRSARVDLRAVDAHVSAAREALGREA